MIQDAELQSLLDDYTACQRGEFALPTLAFTVATMIVESNETGLLDLVPSPLSNAVVDMARAYKRDGTLASLSSAGKVFHNELGARLAALLNARFGEKGY